MIRLLIALSFCPVLASATAAEPIDIGSRRDVSQLAGQSVRLKFELKDADLYSFRFIK